MPNRACSTPVACGSKLSATDGDLLPFLNPQLQQQIDSAGYLLDLPFTEIHWFFTTLVSSLYCPHCANFKMRSFADRLRSVGSQVSDEDLLLYILNGLGREYDPVVAPLTALHQTFTRDASQLLERAFIPWSTTSSLHRRLSSSRCSSKHPYIPYTCTFGPATRPSSSSGPCLIFSAKFQFQFQSRSTFQCRNALPILEIQTTPYLWETLPSLSTDPYFQHGQVVGSDDWVSAFLLKKDPWGDTSG